MTNDKTAIILVCLLGLTLVALASVVGGETQTWDDEADFAGGDLDAIAWDGEREGLTLTGEDVFWRYRSNPVLVEGSDNKWDDSLVTEPSVVYARGKYYLYYTGYDGSSEYAIGVARSSNGKSFTKYSSGNPILQKHTTGGRYDSTAVRDPFVIYEDGIFKMWFTGINGVVESIGYATSSNGLTFTKRTSAVLDAPTGLGVWGSNEFGDPCVVKVDGKYYMYLTGSGSDNKKKVGLATSSDGISWTYYGSNPILSNAPSGEFGTYDICDVAVVREGPVFHMYFSGRASGEDYLIGYAWSYDGVNWERRKTVYMDVGDGFDDSQLQSPAAIWVDGVLMMYYHGDDGAGTHGIGLVTMKPWITRARFGTNPILGTGGYANLYLQDPCLVQSLTKGIYHIYYGCDGSGAGDDPEIARAASSDLETGFANNKSASTVLTIGGTDEWDDAQVQSPCVVNTGGELRMYYAGNDGSTWAIGLATSTSLQGTSWNRYGSSAILTKGSSGAWDDANVMDPWVLKVDGVWHMYYAGAKSSGYTHIGHATSTDGLAWTKDSANPVLSPDLSSPWEPYYLRQPCVIYENGVWTMYYSGSDSASSGWRIGVAQSLDGGNWTRDPMSPMMDMANDTKWDDDGLMIGSVFVKGERRYVYYAGYNGANWQIGLAHFYSREGHYTSPVMDASGHWPVEWGNLEWDADVPAGSQLRFQVASNNGGSIWSFVGPDGTSATYFESSGQGLHPSQSGRFMRVRAFLTATLPYQRVPLIRSISVTYGEREFPTPPSVTVTSPNGGEDWMKTKAYPITWTATGNLNGTSISLWYSTDNGTSWTSIATGQPDTGHYKWTVPSTETSGALIRVNATDIDGNTGSDTSDATFAIDPPPPKAGEFLSPVETAVLAPGPHRASWVVLDPWGLAERPLALELSTDGGVSWTVLADGLPFTDGLDWEVPDLPHSSDACRLRLTVISWLGDLSSIESGTFAIDVEGPSITMELIPGKLVAGKEVEVSAVATDDLAIEGVTLVITDRDGSVTTRAMERGEDGVWRVTLELAEGMGALHATASDGVHATETSTWELDVRTASAPSGTSSLALELVVAAVAAILVCIGVLVIARRRG